MTPDVADLQARVAYLSDELARAKMALASPGCGEACPVATKLRALLASCDERLDEFGCGACYVPPRAPVEAVPEAVGEAMTTMRKSLAQERAAHLATRQELSMALGNLSEALRGLLDNLNGYEHHPDLCSRTMECDDSDEDGCSYCGSDECPVCECGLAQTQAAMSVARAALAGSPSETRTLPVDDEAEARFEKLLAKRWSKEREVVESWSADSRRALAERVREAIAQQLSAYDAPVVRALDLDVLLEEP